MGERFSERNCPSRTYKSNLVYGRQLRNGLDLLLSGSYFFSHGPDQLYFKEFDNPETNYGIAEDADGARFDHLFGKLSYRGLSLEGSYGASEQTDPTASCHPFDPEQVRAQERWAENLGRGWPRRCRASPAYPSGGG